TVFQDVAVDAWAEAGGFSYAKTLLMAKWPVTGPDDPRPWGDFLREQIQKRAASPPPKRKAWGFGPRGSVHRPASPPELIAPCRSGDPHALAGWADALDQAGATDAAGLLRWLPTFRDRIAEEVNAVAPSSGFSIAPNKDGYAWWWIGDTCSETNN